MKVRQKNPLLEAQQLTFDNAEKLQEELGGQLLWGPREDGIPTPILELKSRSGGRHIPPRVRITEWVITAYGREIIDVVSDEVFRSEFVQEESSE